jgi:hypothetical protein
MHKKLIAMALYLAKTCGIVLLQTIGVFLN